MLFATLAVSALAGTAVGHPVPTTTSIVSGLVFTQGAVPISTIVVDRCDDTFDTFDVDATLDPTDGDTLVFPEGWTCGIRIDLSDRLLLGGYGTGGGLFALSLGIDHVDVTIDTPIFVPTDHASGGTALRFAATDWVTATLLDLEANEIVVVGQNHALHDQLAAAVQDDSIAW